MGHWGMELRAGLCGHVDLGRDSPINKTLGGKGCPRAESLSVHSTGQLSSRGGQWGGGAGLGSGQENIWRLHSRPEAKFSKLPQQSPSSSLAITFLFIASMG